MNDFFSFYCELDIKNPSIKSLRPINQELVEKPPRKSNWFSNDRPRFSKYALSWECITRSRIVDNNRQRKKTNNFFFLFLPNQRLDQLNYRKSMTVWTIFEKSSKCDVAGLSSFFRLEMASDWRKISLIEKRLKKGKFCFFSTLILVSMFLSIVQLRIVTATWYPWAN